MKVGLGLLPVAELEVRFLHHEVYHTAIIESHSDFVILIKLEQIDHIRILIADIGIIRNSKEFDSV